MAHNLKPRPHFDIKAEKKLQAAIFTADEDSDGGKKRADFSYTPDEPLHWWYSFDNGTNWRKIPQSALVELDGNLRMVKVLVELLEPNGHQGPVTIAVTEDADRRPTTEEVVVFQAAFLPPAVPFHLEGGESRGAGEAPRSVDVSLNRSRVPNTKDEILWIVIRGCSNALSFSAYQDFMDGVFSNPRFSQAAGHDRKRTLENIDVPIDTFMFNSVDSDRVLKAATELFVMTRCGVIRTETLRPNTHEEEERFGHRLPSMFEHMWHHYLEPLGGLEGRQARILPYLDLIRRKLGDIATVRPALAGTVDQQAALIQEKLMHPVLLELIWSYWMEEGMLVQSFNSITRRFQNVRTNGERDPLAQLELDPLRPASNLLWGWVQDETNRLSVLRRAHEYEHQYGFTLHGKAIAELRTAERRSKFLEAFHNLLWRCTQFYGQDDQTTVIADAFPVLNALKETHYLLAQGASNQFGNLPSQARQEMMMQQWILSRPEIREFLGSRVMVPYPEPWMDRVDSVKTLKGWTDTSVVHFRDLATFGEQVLLSVRWGAWSTINDPASAANWARYWRAEIQGYIHAYRVATSVDLTADVTDTRQAETRFLPPSVHLRNRLLTQATAR
jgi:hypothetical protein